MKYQHWSLSLLVASVNAFAPISVVHRPATVVSLPCPAIAHRNYSILSLSKGILENEASDRIDMNVAELLDSSLAGNTDSTSTILEQIKNLRETGKQDEVETLLDGILSLVDDTKLPLWTNIRVTSKISKRGRRAALHRLIDMSTPSAPEDNDTEDAKQGRRRRALVVALRSLMPSDESEAEDEQQGRKKKDTSVSIRKVEKAAREDLKSKISSDDMKSRIPPGLETPKYDVIVKRDKYEVRNYESFSVCSVPMARPRPDASSTDQKVSQPQLAGASSFGALAGYLFGKNEEQVAMKMTTPVLTTGEGDGKEMSFVLPSKYWEENALSTAPSPLKNSLVQLKTDGGGKRAAAMFGGFVSSKDAEVKKKELLANLESDKDWVPIEGATVTLAQYNDPFTPPWRRLSEVSVNVEAR